ncbi:MAG TPA: hypothetical protein DEQ14_03560 [Treponema sp.]|nr:hypothetical protein [Treponema sp.]
MPYKRYKSSVSLSKPEKVELMNEYISFYSDLIQKHDCDVLNVKIPREIFSIFLDDIGSKLNEYAIKMAEGGPVKDFLDSNPLPPHMKELLPDDFRAFSLLLNALKQWVSAESLSTDRFLLGGTARQTCREAVSNCIVTGDELGNNPELHHPLRDGRPPIYISKTGHDLIEHKNKQSDNQPNNELLQIMKTLKKEKHMSWVLIREGCNAIITRSTQHRPNAMSHANTIIKATGMSATEVINFLNLHNL